MPTANLGLQYVPENTLQPGVPVNAAIDAVDKIMAGTVTRNLVANANYTLLAADYSATYLNITDTGVVLTVGRDIVFPANFPRVTVKNATAQILTLKKSGQPGFTLAAGATKTVVAGITDVIDTAGAAGQASIQFKDEGVNLGASGVITTQNFTGAGVTASEAAGVVTVNIPGGGSGGTGYQWADSFIRGVVTSTASGTAFVTNDYRAVAYTNGVAATAVVDAPGVVIKTGTALNGLVNLFATHGLRLKPGLEAMRFGSRVVFPIISDGTHSFSFSFGLRTVITGVENDYITANYTHSVNTGKWVLTCVAAGVSTSVNSTSATVAATTYYEVEIEINAAASLVTLYVDGVSVATCATNIPTVAQGLACQIYKTLGATERTAQVARMYQKAS